MTIDTIRSSFPSDEEKDDRWMLLVARDDEGQIIGYCKLGNLENECPLLSYLFVGEKHRRAGVAMALIERCAGLMRNENRPSIVLSVKKKNTSAVALYQKMGFVFSSDDKNNYWMCLNLRADETKIRKALRKAHDDAGHGGVLVAHH